MSRIIRVSVLVVLGALAAVVAASLLRDRPAVPATSPDPIRLEVGGRRLDVPANTLRFPDQRRPGVRPRLDLALTWPELEGRTAENGARFDTPDYAADVLYLTIEPRHDASDSASRLTAVYARFFVGEPWDGPGGLQGRRLAPKSGYTDEEIWLEPGAVHPFVARCFPLAPGGPPLMCLHDVVRGSLAVSLRFPKALLGDWRAIEDTLDQRLAAWGVETD